MLNEEKFIFVKGGTRFEEVEDGKVKCGGCKNNFSRIIGHLKKSLDCQSNIDMAEFELLWKKVGDKRKSARYATKRKAENEDHFLQKQNKRRRTYVEKKRAENEENFLKEKANQRRSCIEKKMAEN